MKAGLKRIEATLHDLGTRGTASAAQTDDSTKRSFSFRISVGANEFTNNPQTASDEQELEPQGQFDFNGETETNSPPEQNLFPQHESVQTFQAEESDGKTPSLPKFKTPSLNSHRHGANPGLAMNLLQEIQASVADWQTELQQILQQIQDIYLEGPIVNGWLESTPQEPEHGGTATLRHAEVDRLMDYVEEICATGGKVSYQSQNSGYRLCGVDTSGKVWSRPCPQEQVATVSMAIARYQKLRQLLGRKQHLETRLSQLAQTLVVLHSHIQQA
jgi:predicted enzyme related to lactoylglutathione lyase